MTYGYIVTISHYLTNIHRRRNMGTKKRKEREREARKNDILEAAKAVFFERGFHAATMDQIAEAAELSKGSLYLYFSSKEELYVSILVEGLEILYDMFEKAVKDIGVWEEKLHNIAMAYYGFYQGNKNYFKILFFLQHGEIATKISDSLFQICFEKGISCLDFLSKAIQEGMEEEEIETSDPMELAVVLWGAFNGIILLYEEEEHRRFIPGLLDNLIRKTIELLTAGLKKR